jgi:hypothetical protein
MAETKAKFPSPEDSDAEDVVLALETANALWGRSDAKEAIRWLRRAAEAAEEAGDDMRALTLARTAADLTTQVEKDTPAPAAKAAASSPASAPRPSQAASAPRPAKPAAATSPAKSSPAAQPAPAATASGTKSSPAAKSAPAASAAAAAPAPEPSKPKTDAPASKSSQPPPPPPPPGSSPVSAHAEPKLTRRSEGTLSGLKAGGSKGAGDKPKDALAHLAALASTDAGTGTPRVRRSLGPYQALRVAVEPSKDDRKLLLARVLNQSEDAPENTHEAMLVCIVPNVDMRSRRR